MILLLKMDQENLNRILQDIQQKTNIKIIMTTPLDGGMNNQIFRIDTDIKSFLLKVYFNDSRRRLFREYSALSYLHQSGINNVPQPISKNDELNYGVYSFEPGKTKKSSELNHKDLTQMISFITKLHQLFPENNQFLPAINSCFSFSDYEILINNRLKYFQDSLSHPDVSPTVLSKFSDLKITTLVYTKLDYIISNTSEHLLSPSEYRLSPTDFGPHNTLFNGQNACFIDFECSGWDDPIKIVAEFINHDKLTDLSLEDKQYFIDEFTTQSSLPKKILDRLPIVIKIMQLEYLTIILGSITPDKIKYRQFSDPKFDINTYISSQITKIDSRVTSINGQ